MYRIVHHPRFTSEDLFVSSERDILVSNSFEHYLNTGSLRQLLFQRFIYDRSKRKVYTFMWTLFLVYYTKKKILNLVTGKV